MIENLLAARAEIAAGNSDSKSATAIVVLLDRIATESNLSCILQLNEQRWGSESFVQEDYYGATARKKTSATARKKASATTRKKASKMHSLSLQEKCPCQSTMSTKSITVLWPKRI